MYSRWLQVPVRIDGDRFAATMEWGPKSEGGTSLSSPRLIVMSGNLDDHNIPVPGRPLTGYLRVSALPTGSRVEVHQLVDTPTQATFMEGAWGMVLGRLKTNLVQPESDEPVRRPRRPRSSPDRRNPSSSR